MPYTPPAGSTAHFTAGGTPLYPVLPGAMVFRFPAGVYTAPAGDAVAAQWPALPVDYVPPPGDAADFVAGEEIPAVVGTGAATVEIVAAGFGAAPVIGFCAVDIGVAAEGFGARGVAGAGTVTLEINVAASGIGQFGPYKVRAESRAPWRKSRGAMRALDSRHVAASRTDHSRRAPWAMAEKREAAAGAGWPQPAPRDDRRAAPWAQFGPMLNEDRAAAWALAIPRDEQDAAVWQVYGPMLNEDRGGRWKGSKAVDEADQARWRGYLVQILGPQKYERPAGDAANFAVYGDGIRAQFAAAGYVPPAGDGLFFQFGAAAYSPPYFRPMAEWYVPPPGNAASFLYSPEMVPAFDGDGNPLTAPDFRDSAMLNPWGKGKRRDNERIVPWVRFSRPLNPGWGVVVPGGPELPEPGSPVIIPVQRVYIVVNDILLTRVDDLTVIAASQLSVSFDCDSWLPSFTATIPESARDAVMPDPLPVEVEAYINGSAFRFFVEKVQRNRQFAQASVSISGRGIASELDAPYAARTQHTNSSAMNAQQLIDAALEFTGYTQTWNITDWLVPSGVFSLHGTPAEVAAAVAEASGSVLAADWALRDLRMLPRYPVKPWDWGSAEPEYTIPAAVTQTESVEWVEKPAYNVVYISGVQAGVLAQVKITGTAGDKPAPMVTHPLITHDDAARQRGTTVLSDTGRKAMMQISLPVLPGTGVIDICRLIEFSDGANTRRGIVRANQVSANWPTVRQTLTIEAAA